MELLREKKRQYLADTSASDRLQRQANFFGDVAKVAGATSNITSSINTIQQNRERAATKQAQSDLTAHEKEAQAAVEDLRSRYGEKITSEKGQQAIRDALAKIRRKYRPEYDDERTGAAYDRLADEYTNTVIDENYLYATRAKIKRQDEERKAAERERATAIKSAANTVQQLGDIYIQQAGELGKSGAIEDSHQFTSDMSKQLDKVLEKVPGTPLQKAEGKLSILTGAELNKFVGGLSSEDPAVAGQTDLALHDVQEFEKFVSPEFVDASINYRKADQLDKWGRERAQLKNQAMTLAGANKAQIEKRIKEIDDKILSLDEKNEIDGENFGDKVKKDLMSEFAAAAEPFANKMLGERSLAIRMAENQRKKEDAAFAMMQPLNPTFKLNLIKMAKEEEKYAEDPQMSYADGKKPKGFWKDFADNVMGYSDNMSHVSQLAYTDVNVQGDANAMIKQLTYEQIESPTGDPVEFEAKVFKVAHDISGLEMSETDRLDKQNQLARLLLANDEDVKDLKAIMESGDVGVLPTFVGALSTKMTGNIMTREMAPTTRVLASDKMVQDAFDQHMYHAEQEYLNVGLNMWANGATFDQVMVERQKIFKKHIDNFYREFHLVNLAELDAKLQNHEKAFATYNGITYEYGGRDPNQRPIWIDHAVTNINRDMNSWLERKPLVGFDKKSERTNNE